MTETIPAPTGPAGAMATAGGAPHPRTVGWLGTTALAMGGSNQSLFLIAGATGLVASQGSAAVPLLILGLLLSWIALPGWIELVLMWPNRVGGIAASCAEAFRPISPVLANLTGVCYWWGWVPTCGLTAILSATAIHTWYLPGIPVAGLAVGLVLLFTAVNFCGIGWVTRLAVPLASASALLAFLSGLVPILAGQVDWQRATTYQLITPFPGAFGALTGAMAGLYLIGFAAPAFEQAACHVGETVDYVRNVPRAMVASAGMATVYFALLPLVWLGVLGPGPLTSDLQNVLGPTFAPLLGASAHAAAIWFIMFNMFHGTLAPLAGAARTLAQLAEDGLLPRILAWRTRTDTPGVATGLTAGMAILFLLGGDPVWVIAAANLCYLIGIGLPSLAVWLLRRSAPDMPRPYRAPRRLVELGVLAAAVWGISAMLGFQQYGLPTVLAGIGLAYSGSALYALRRYLDRTPGPRRFGFSLHIKLTGAMLLVLAFDGAGYLLAVNSVRPGQPELITLLEDIFVIVALLTITVGLVLPGIVAHTAQEVAAAAERLATGTLADFSRAMQALATGDLDAAHARVDITPLAIRSNDEMGAMAASFDLMQQQIARAAADLDAAREGVRHSRDELRDSNAQLHYQAYHDALTDLPNRWLFMSRLEYALQHEDPAAGATAVLLIDLDRFKVINDSLGHDAGDRLLVAVAGRLATCTRRQDTIARFGGDEFTILLETPVLPEEVTRVAERVLAALQAPFDLGAQEIFTTTSIGIALSNGSENRPADLLREADVALYQAKRRGKARYAIYDASMNAHALEQLALEGQLQRALERDEFMVYYQPKVMLATGEIEGLEALVRWMHPQRGLISPAEFIPLAEETGLIRPLGQWVLQEACRQARVWHELLPRAAPLVMSVNLSAQEFQHPDLVENVARALRETGVAPASVQLEITEGVVMEDAPAAVATLEKLKRLGVGLAIDDFGTGYSSLSYLKRFPVDVLKIDRAFVTGCGTDPENRAIVQAVISLAQALKLTVIAEGVETVEEAQQLRALACPLAQGNYFAPAVPSATATGLLLLGLAAVPREPVRLAPPALVGP